MYGSYIAVGDSFTEGLGDEHRGQPRGWADLVAEALACHYAAANTSGQDFQYANLAVRGKKLLPIIAEQLAPAVEQKPDLISFNAGGNDMLRPKFRPELTLDSIAEAIETMRRGGSEVLLLAGPDPVNNLPLGETFSRRGALYTRLCEDQFGDAEGVTFVDNFSDRAFEDSTYWSEDGLHLSTAGHLRVAANCLDALNVPYPEHWEDPRFPAPDPKNYRSASYFRQHIAPWVGRRLTGRSSGDGRTAKRPVLTPLTPSS